MAADAEGPARGSHRLAAFVERRFPAWESRLVVLVAVAIDFALPDRLIPGPVWLLPGVEALLLFALVAITPHPRLRHSQLRRRFAVGLTAFVSAVNVVSLCLLVHFLLQGHLANNGHALILAGAGLWITNVLLFGLWYWELDRGGPLGTAESAAHPDFLFPQMADERFSPPDWRPELLDYLYLSFTNAAAFSPTDTMPLTRGAKALMALQAMVALITLALVVSRAVNVLG